MPLLVKSKDFFDYIASPLYPIKSRDAKLTTSAKIYIFILRVIVFPLAIVVPLFSYAYKNWHKKHHIRQLEGTPPILLRPNLLNKIPDVPELQSEKDKKIYPGLFKGPLGGIYNSNFFEALNCGQPSAISAREFRKKDAIWQQLKINYDTFINRLKNAPRQDKYTYLIPPKIHLIWIGNEPNEEVKRIKKSWDDFHPTWDVKLWRNEDTAAIIAEYRQKYPNIGEAWDNAHTYAEKADIARYCIVHKEGGTYVDTDLPCYGAIDDIHCFSKLCVGMETNRFDRGIIFTGNAWISAEVGNEVIENTIKAVKPYKPNHGLGGWDLLNRTGPGILTNEIYKILAKARIAYERARAAGPEDRAARIAWEEFLAYIAVMPPTYFYPLPFKMEFNNPSYKKQFEQVQFPWIKGIHLWNSSWVGHVKN